MGEISIMQPGPAHDGCTGHKGLHLLALPQKVVTPIVDGFRILLLATAWAAGQPDLADARVVAMRIGGHLLVDLPEGQFVRVSSMERDAVAHLLEEAAYAWMQDAASDIVSESYASRPEWAAEVYDHLAFYTRCAYRQGWVR